MFFYVKSMFRQLVLRLRSASGRYDLRDLAKPSSSNVCWYFGDCITSYIRLVLLTSCPSLRLTENFIYLQTLEWLQYHVNICCI